MLGSVKEREYTRSKAGRGGEEEQGGVRYIQKQRIHPLKQSYF